MRAMRINEDPSSLARYLAAAYALLIVYASLHPFSGWVDNGAVVGHVLFNRLP